MLTEKYKKAHMEKLRVGYVLTAPNDWDIPIEEQVGHHQTGQIVIWSFGNKNYQQPIQWC